MKDYSRVYGFSVTESIRKGKIVLLADLASRTIDRADKVTVRRLIEAIDDESGRFVFYEQEEKKQEENQEVAHE